MPKTDIQYGTFRLRSPKQVTVEELAVEHGTNGTMVVHIKGLKSENDAAVLGAIAQARAKETEANWSGINALVPAVVAAGVKAAVPVP